MNFAFLLLHATEVYILGLHQGDDCIAFSRHCVMSVCTINVIKKKYNSALSTSFLLRVSLGNSIVFTNVVFFLNKKTKDIKQT